MQNHCRRLEPRVVEHELFTWKNGALGVDGRFDEEAVYGGRTIRLNHPFESAVSPLPIANPWLDAARIN